MSEEFLKLSPAEQRDALETAAQILARRVDLLQKDVWVVWALEALFASEFAPHLTFKGGTSLSKGYGIIKRFSEDVDITYDVRKLIDDITGDRELPETASQARKWTDAVRARLPLWVRDQVVPLLEAYAQKTGVTAKITAEGDCAFVNYDPDASPDVTNGYVKPRVMLEFGARSTGEPAEVRPVTCDAESVLSSLVFPKATPRVMQPARTFWEKATAVHVFCLGGKVGERYARHWYDLVRLDEAGFAEAAKRDRDLAQKVATHKALFFAAKGQDEQQISYADAVGGRLVLIPSDPETLRALADDYQKMLDAGLLDVGAESFEELLTKCGEIERRVNEAAGA